MEAVIARNAGRLILAATVVLVVIGALLIGLTGAIFHPQQQGCAGAGGGIVGGAPSVAARNAIPARLLGLYQAAQQRYGVPWSVLAAINRVETDFGRNLAVSSAGALGWMQFMPATWAEYGVDGNDDGKNDPWNPEDAIPAAANYLKASGSGRDLHDAIFAYNHSEAYVQSVLAYARLYAHGNFTVLDGEPAGSGGLRYPLAQRGPIVATADAHRERALGDWQSDNAIDIAVAAGTAVLAVADATVARTSGSPPTHRSDTVGGYSITLSVGDHEAFYTHLTQVLVVRGQRLKAGQKIGESGSANQVEHLHVAVKHGNPMAIWGGAAATTMAASANCSEPALTTGPAELDKAVTLHEPRTYTKLPRWAMASGRAPQEFDTRLVPDLLWVLATYGLRVTAAREAGHRTHGDGTAVDLVPAESADTQDGWNHSARRLAHDLGWTQSCAQSGVAPACPLKPAIRGVFYNGFPNHGDPWHCAIGCSGGPHLHLSWMASRYGAADLAAPNDWVRAFAVPRPDGGDPLGAPVSAPAVPGAPSRTMAVVGDSLAAATRRDLAGELPGWRISTDAEAGRPLADGMRIIETLRDRPAVLAVSLFANDDPRRTDELARAVRRSVQGRRCVLWATIHRPPVMGVSYAAANRTLYRLADELPALHIVPWDEAVDQHPDWIGPDGVHATATGWAGRARLYARAASRCAT